MTVVIIGQDYNKYFILFIEEPNPTYEQIMESIPQNNWFKYFPPKQILEIQENKKREDLHSITMFYMQKYGVSNVRDHTYLSDNFSIQPKVYKSILKELGVKNIDLYDHYDINNDKTKKTNEMYANGPYLSVDYYNNTGRCDCCGGKMVHEDRCCYSLIRPLPKPTEN
jgi:hypothetical protein